MKKGIDFPTEILEQDAYLMCSKLHNQIVHCPSAKLMTCRCGVTIGFYREKHKICEPHLNVGYDVFLKLSCV